MIAAAVYSLDRAAVYSLDRAAVYSLDGAAVYSLGCSLQAARTRTPKRVCSLLVDVLQALLLALSIAVSRR